MSEVVTYTAGVKLDNATNAKLADATTLYVLDFEVERPFTDSPFGGDIYSMAQERIKAMGIMPNSYRLLGVLRGKYMPTEEFLEELDRQYYYEEMYYEELAEAEEEEQRQQEWDEYVNEHYTPGEGWHY